MENQRTTWLKWCSENEYMPFADWRIKMIEQQAEKEISEHFS